MNRLVIVFSLLLIFLSVGVVFVMLTGFQLPQKQTNTPTISKTSDVNSERLWSLIQEWRKEQKLPAFTKNETLCKMTQERAPEIYSEFVKKIPHSGFYEKYSNSTYDLAENAAALRKPADDNEKTLLSGWTDSPPHLKQLQANWKYSCVACSKSACSQIFSNF